jgi:hypothetical protein
VLTIVGKEDMDAVRRTTRARAARSSVHARTAEEPEIPSEDPTDQAYSNAVRRSLTPETLAVLPSDHRVGQALPLNRDSLLEPND